MANRTGKAKPGEFDPFYHLGSPFTAAILWCLRSILKFNSLLIAYRLSLIAYLRPKRKPGRPKKKKSLPAPFSLFTSHLSLPKPPHLLLRQRLLKKKLFRFKQTPKPKHSITIYQQFSSHRLTHIIFSRRTGLVTLAFLSITLISSITFYFYILKDLPDPSQLATNRPIVTTKIYDRHGNLLYKIFKNENRSLVTLEEIPLHLQQATIAIEDQNFYTHSGFSLKGIARAFKTNLENDSLHGGSTITQQLIKNTLLTSEKTITRKIKELILSVITEFYFDKDEILTMYFNQTPYGGAAYGVEETSQMFFGKSVQHLTLSESAFLAGLPAAPTRYSPYGTQPELSIIRQHQVLRRMVEDGYITLAEAEEAKSKKITVLPQKNSIKAPHFVMYIKDLLVQQYGLQAVEQGGLEVITSLDLNTQELAQNIVSAEVDKLTNLNVHNGAALVTNPKTGEILAMVGSKDYFDTTSDGQVNITLRPRQPGSSIKPINYAAALENGFTPATIIPDSPICYRLPGQKPYCPKNYDNRFHGNVRLRDALANSYNVPAVKILSQIGVDTMIKKAQDMGITTWDDPSRFGLSLTLGGGEIKMVDMAVAYSSFSNHGYKVDLNPILQVKNYQGKILHKFDCSSLSNTRLSPVDPVEAATSSTCEGTRVLDPRVAYQITDILSDNAARTPAFGSNSVLNVPPHQVAVKTGTTNNLRDNWTIGYTSNYLVITWVGNNDNAPMSYIASGITGASPIWNYIMTSLLDENQPHTFMPPANLTKVKICTLTGTLSCNGCPSKEEYFLPGTEPTQHCSENLINQLRAKQESDRLGRDRLLEGISTQQ